MRKFNIATEYNRSFYNAARNQMNDGKGLGYMYGCLNHIEEQVMDFIKEKIRLLNPENICF